ncbi:MAG: transketolase [Labilithrix sp.]|nr:transketolase [Labilithrix sp.]MCW5815976.1 transketolase [Labilithrix sp.]
MSDHEHLEHARELAAQLRVDSLRCSTEAGSGHPTSSLSAADLMAVLLSSHLRADLRRTPPRASDDQLIFSKGHASPLLYSMLKAAAVISEEELLTYRRARSRLEGHPVPPLPGVLVASGSLGQGLPIAVGVALSARRLEESDCRVWVLVGDSEMSEGSIWEAFDHARHYALGNLIAVLDMNRLGQRGETPLGWDSGAYAARARAFGWRAIEIDGHDLAAIDEAYAEASRGVDVPTLIVARTVKGKGVSFLEDEDGWHGKALDEEQCAKAIAELGSVRSFTIALRAPASEAPAPAPAVKPLALPRYERSKRVATRRAYGDALAALGAARPDVVVLDAEVNNSTYAEDFAKAHPERYFEMFISEQQMVAAAVGMSVRGKAPFASTFGAFLTRAYDFVRMAAISRADLRLCGSHAGVSIGEDGPSQMALEDLAMMRAVHGSTVLYPCCANQTAKLVAAMAEQRGVVYLRTTREKTPVLYDADDVFRVGGSKVLRRAKGDRVTVVTAGITVHEALEAHARLAAEGIGASVIDAYSVKPLDADTIRDAAQATHGNVVVVEDHWPEGGLGDAVLECLTTPRDPIAARVVRLAVRAMPGSAKPAEQLAAAGIDAAAIADAVRALLSRGAGRGAAPPSSRRRATRGCYLCGATAAWRIALAGEDEPIREEDACEEHASGHRRIAALPLAGGAPQPAL